ncbi:YcxB-like protein [Lachnospiraceae bacterium NK3A20]|nr:YcxB-like protein [Lachnospiraceae bacterium NK3A20]
MKFEFNFRNTPGDYFLYRMGNIYRSWLCVINIVFTAAIIALIWAKWSDTNGLGKAIMVIALLVFPVFQPLFTYFSSIRDALSIRENTTLTFDELGLKIHVFKHSQHIAWKDFYALVQRRTMLLIVPDGQHAYILTNRILGSQRDELASFCEGKIAQYSRFQDQKKRVR